MIQATVLPRAKETPPCRVFSCPAAEYSAAAGLLDTLAPSQTGLTAVVVSGAALCIVRSPPSASITASLRLPCDFFLKSLYSSLI